MISMNCRYFYVFALSAFFAAGPAQAEKWVCVPGTYWDERSDIVLELTMAQESVGLVTAAGTTQTAIYYVSGLNRHWDFGTDFNHSVRLRPNGIAHYFNFEGVPDGEKITPQQTFACRATD